MVRLRHRSWDAHYSLSQGIITKQPTANDGGAIYLQVAISRCEMTDLTRYDNLTHVHNGRLCHQYATLLAGQVKPTHSLSLVLEAESTKSLPSKL